MTRRLLFGIALAIGMSACTTLQPSRPDVVDVTKACAEWRWIGISRPGARCPEISDWTVHPLFAPVDSFRQGSSCVRGDSGKGPDPELIRELNRFCVYEAANRKKWLGFKPPPPPVSAELVRIDQ